MDLEFKKLSAENVEGLSSYYGQRHDRTCDSVILDYFLWSNYYRVYYTKAPPAFQQEKAPAEGFRRALCLDLIYAPVYAGTGSSLL